MEPLACCYEGMEMSSITSSLTIPSSSVKHTQILFPKRHRFIRSNPISCSSSNVKDEGNSVPADSIQAVEVRFRRRSRRQSRKQRESDGSEASRSSVQSMKVSESGPKKWEDMSLTEKAMELYVGEKGALFWLNKFAYASIFIMIGVWILFRFVGPALNLYQLDSPPLSPSSILKG